MHAFPSSKAAVRRSSPAALLLASALWGLTGCDCAPPATGADGGDDGGDTFIDAGADAGADGGAGDSGTPDAGPAPSVLVRDGRLVVDGVPMTLFGGELQYFRVRDLAYDAARTRARWQQTLDSMAAANMQLLTTYFPWDYHSPAQGAWDFSGARDADAFLDLACSRGFKIFARPGPLITGEWPKGPGTFGAVPTWWKTAHPEALALRADGTPFNFSVSATAGLKNDPTQVQPSYLHPAYLSAVGDWYDRIAPILKKYVDRRCVIGVQLDNETNLYWSDHFGDVDYSPVALQRFRAFLQQKYPTIGALNAAWGSAFADFASVQPPTTGPTSPAQDVRVRDWYQAGHALVGEYLHTLRQMLEQRGLREPDVLFLTNDSSFGLAGKSILLHDGAMKNRDGLAGFDVYPKMLVTNNDLLDNPFQVEHAVKTFEGYNRLYSQDTGAGFTFGAELQGGFFDFPVAGPPNVRPEATDQVLAKAFGHGMRVGSVYVYRGGYNLDDTVYDFQAALAPDGTPRPRNDVLRAWGWLVRGEHVAEADSVEDPIAILLDSHYQVPQANTKEMMEPFWANEMPGVYGWLANAGFNPVFLDARQHPDLSPYKLVIFVCPEFVADDTARLLLDYHRQGGVLLQVLSPGARGLDGRPSAEVASLAALYSATWNFTWDFPSVVVGLRAGDVISQVPAAPGVTTAYWYASSFTPPGGAATFLVEKQWNGSPGRTIGFTWTNGVEAPTAFIGTNLTSVYNSSFYYGAGADDLARKRALALHVAAAAGLHPRLVTGGVRELAWARTLRDGRRLIFMVNDHAAGTVHLTVADPAGVGLTAAQYHVRNARRHRPRRAGHARPGDDRPRRADGDLRHRGADLRAALSASPRLKPQRPHSTEMGSAYTFASS